MSKGTVAVVIGLIVIAGGAYALTLKNSGPMQGDAMQNSNAAQDHMATSGAMMGSSTGDTMHDDSGAMMDASASVDTMMH